VSAFFDTNVLVYLFDWSSFRKRHRARDLFRERAARDEVLLSVQVLQELYVTLTRKLAHPVRADRAERLVRSFARRNQLSLWDALIVVAAKAGGASELLSEDLQSRQIIEGLRVVNPFATA
jgi:predicted nucleic acid-binding protein